MGLKGICSCTFADMVCILISIKRTKISDDGKSILIKKGVSKKNAVIKIRGNIIPKEINTRTYRGLFVKAKDVEHLHFYN